jgi:cytochrome c-type biogenesis protein CcmH
MVARLAARLEDAPDDLEGWQRLGRAYSVLGEPAKAADAWSRAAQLAPADVDVLVAYGEALVATTPPGSPVSSDALKVMRQALVLDGQRPEALWLVATAEAEQGNRAVAVDLLSRLLLRLNPASPDYADAKARLDTLTGAK